MTKIKKTLLIFVLLVIIATGLFLVKNLEGSCCTGNCCCPNLTRENLVLVSYGCVCSYGALIWRECEYSSPLK